MVIMSDAKNHICVCICTYRRPQFLKHLLLRLEGQRTDGLFTYSIVVVDNDRTMSAKYIVEEVKKESSVPISYFLEERKSIPLARNKAVENACGDFVAFIDDDEFPVKDWLLNLYNTYRQYKTDGVLGPVRPYFESSPPAWILRGNFCQRPFYKTGTLMHWTNSRTGNVLLGRHLFQGRQSVFDPQFGVQGEDVMFFKKMIEKGYRFVWCNEAPVYEVIPFTRCNKTYFVRRAFIQGNASSKYFKDTMTLTQKTKAIIKSAVAVFLYTPLLPISVLLGQHFFMKYLIKDIHHFSRLLGLLDIVTVTRRTV